MSARPLVAALIASLALAGCSRPADDTWLPTAPQALLWDMFYAKVVVEVDHVRGREIPQDALVAAIEELRSLTGRAIELGSVRQIPDVDPDPSRRRSGDEAFLIARRTLDDPATYQWFGANGSAVLHIVSLDGGVGEAAHPLGEAGHNTALVFLDQLAALQPAGRDHPNYALDVRQTLTHEMGHTVGLVGCHLPMVRPHDDGNCHSTSRASVMYVPREWTDSTVELVRPGTQRLRFDADDRADVAAYVEQGRRCARDPVACAEPWRGSVRE